MAVLYTIGHSTRSFDELVAALRAHRIETLVDIRAFPASKRLPQFNRDSLQQSLPAAGIRYISMTTLGGYRKKILEESPHIALRNQSFRNYADYMLTPDFERQCQNCLRWRKTLVPPTCAPNAYISSAIACWSPTGWWLMDTKCCISTLRVRLNRTSLWPKPASWTVD